MGGSPQPQRIRAAPGAPRIIITRVIVFLLVGAIVVLTVTMLVHSWRREHTFDATRWKRAAYPQDQYRVRVVDELLRSHDFRNMTRSQVADLLGPADTFAQKTKPENMVYW